MAIQNTELQDSPALLKTHFVDFESQAFLMGITLPIPSSAYFLKCDNGFLWKNNRSVMKSPARKWGFFMKNLLPDTKTILRTYQKYFLDSFSGIENIPDSNL